MTYIMDSGKKCYTRLSSTLFINIGHIGGLFPLYYSPFLTQPPSPPLQRYKFAYPPLFTSKNIGKFGSSPKILKCFIRGTHPNLKCSQEWCTPLYCQCSREKNDYFESFSAHSRAHFKNNQNRSKNPYSTLGFLRFETSKMLILERKPSKRRISKKNDHPRAGNDSNPVFPKKL